MSDSSTSEMTSVPTPPDRAASAPAEPVAAPRAERLVTGPAGGEAPRPAEAKPAEVPAPKPAAPQVAKIEEPAKAVEPARVEGPAKAAEPAPAKPDAAEGDGAAEPVKPVRARRTRRQAAPAAKEEQAAPSAPNDAPVPEREQGGSSQMDAQPQAASSDAAAVQEHLPLEGEGAEAPVPERPARSRRNRRGASGAPAQAEAAGERAPENVPAPADAEEAGAPVAVHDALAPVEAGAARTSVSERGGSASPEGGATATGPAQAGESEGAEGAGESDKSARRSRRSHTKIPMNPTELANMGIPMTPEIAAAMKALPRRRRGRPSNEELRARKVLEEAVRKERERVSDNAPAPSGQRPAEGQGDAMPAQPTPAADQAARPEPASGEQRGEEGGYQRRNRRQHQGQQGQGGFSQPSDTGDGGSRQQGGQGQGGSGAGRGDRGDRPERDGRSGRDNRDNRDNRDSRDNRPGRGYNNQQGGGQGDRDRGGNGGQYQGRQSRQQDGRYGDRDGRDRDFRDGGSRGDRYNDRYDRRQQRRENRQREVVAPKANREELAELKVAELRTKATELGIDDAASLKKPELIEAVYGALVKQEGFFDCAGVLDLMPEGYGFVRTKGYLPSEGDVYVGAQLIRSNGLRRGDWLAGIGHASRPNDKYPALARLESVNGRAPEEMRNRPRFADLTPVFPDERLRMEHGKDSILGRCIDLVAPIGKGQRGLIVSPPKAGKTTVLKKIAESIAENNPEVHLICLLVDERPEEVTDMQRSIKGEVVASTFDMPCDNHITVSELVIERAKRLVELGQDVVILLDSITRLARAYNLAQPASGRILSGGVDSTALYPPKRFLGAARNIEGGGSLTILASALVETGSKMDEVIFEEFKGTGNMELKLDRDLADRRIFPAIDPIASGTRKEELLLDPGIAPFVWGIRRILANMNNNERAMNSLIKSLKATANNEEFLIRSAKKAQNQEIGAELQ